MIEWMFWEMWGYTKLTFRIFRWVFGVIISISAWKRNRNQNIPKVAKSDLFDQDQK